MPSEYFESLSQQLAEKHQSQSRDRVEPRRGYEDDERSTLETRPSFEAAKRTHMPVVTLAHYQCGEWVHISPTFGGCGAVIHSDSIYEGRSSSKSHERSLESLSEDIVKAATNGIIYSTYLVLCLLMY